MKYASLSLLLFVFFFAACEDDDDPLTSQDVTLELDFKGEFDGQDLAILSETYDYPGGDQLKIQLFQYYVSDLELIPADGSAPVSLSEIELIRYGSATEDNIDTRSFTVPSGDYSGIRFGIGVKPELNALAPSNFSATDPLNENEFWNDNARYVFAKIEANADLNEDAIFDTGISLHMGNDDFYQTITFDRNFTLAAGQDAGLTVVADVMKALGGTTDTYDITLDANQRVHGGNQALARGVFERLAQQFTLEQ